MPVVLLIPFFIFFSGCSKAPELPRLGRQNQSEPTRRILSSRLEPKDYREIFQAINRDGKLDSLKAYFEKPSEVEHRSIGAVISRHLYENDEALDILSARIQKRSFSEPLSLLPHRELFFAALGTPQMRALAGKTHSIWSEEWAKTARAIRDAADAYSVRRSNLLGSLLLKDLETFLDSDFRAEAEELWTVLKRDRAGSTILGTLSALREEHGLPAFRGLGLGLSELLPKSEGDSNTLHKVLDLIHLAHRPTEGLFEAISLKLIHEPDLIHEIANRIRPMVTRAAVGFSEELLTESPQSTWLALPKEGDKLAEIFITYRTALERVAGPVQELTVEPEAFIHNLRIYTNAFALTKWTVALATTYATLWSTIPKAEFEKNFWDLPVKMEVLTWDLRSPEMLAEMKALGLDDFATQLEKAKDVPLGNFVYAFPATAEAVPLRKAFGQAMESVSGTRPFADPTSFVRALAYPLTRPEAGGFFTFKDLESDSLMVWINEHLAEMSLEAWRKLKKTLFDDMELVQLDDPHFDMRKLILGFFPSEPLRTRVIEILDRIPALYELDRVRNDLPTPFVAYLSLMKERPRTLKSTTSLLGFVGKSKLLTYDFPFFFDLVKHQLPVGRGLAALSVLDADERDAFLAPLSGIEPELLFSLLDKLVKHHPKNLESLVDDFFHSTLWDRVPELTTEERIWLDEFLASPDWQTAWDFFHAHASRENSRQLVSELKNLTASGYLREAAKLLYHFQNDQLHRLADLWLEWERSGQWAAFLDRAQELLAE